MLTNSQSWRRANVRYSKHKHNRTEEYLQYCSNKIDKNTNLNNILIIDTDCSKRQSIKRVKSEIEEEYNDFSRDSDFLSISSIPASKTLTFDSRVKVYLIPNRNDFMALFSELFWQREDYHHFKEDAHKELQAYWKSNKSSVREAITALYQPVVVVQTCKEETENTIISAIIKKSIMTHNDSVNNFASLMELSHQSDASLNNNELQSISIEKSDHDYIQLNINNIDNHPKINLNKSGKGLLSHNDSLGNLANMILEDEKNNGTEINVSNSSEKLHDFIYLDITFKKKFLSHNDSVPHLAGSFSDNETIQSNGSSLTTVMEDDYSGLDII